MTEQNHDDACGASRSDAVLAAMIARAIFDCGNESPQYGGKTQRIQFMGGTYPDNERAIGGLNEMALASVIKKALADNA